jgi:integrase
MSYNKSENKFLSPMKDLLYCFLESKKAAGYKYREEERSLFILDKFLNTTLSSHEDPFINCDIVRQYIAKWGNESDTTRMHRLSLLRQFCLFLSFDDPRTFVPPRRFMGIKRCVFTPRILTRIECKKFVEACSKFPNSYNSPLRGTVLGTALLTLFFTGIRAGEALRLTIQDIDLCSSTLHIRDTKFGKFRYVPISHDVRDRLYLCKENIIQKIASRNLSDPFFCTSTGLSYSISALRVAFKQVISRSGIAVGGNIRMHDLRHNAAMLRMLLWYEEGVNLEAKLPTLATYMGHKNLMSTQKYLHLTKELLIPIMNRYQARFGHIINDGGMP